MARQVLENGVILPAEYSDDWYDDMTSNLTKLDDVIGSDSEKLSSSDVGAAALSNNYNDLDNLPTIPTVNDATLTIQKNGVDVQTFTANASSNVTCNITVPTKTSDLTNDSNFVVSSSLANVATSGDYDDLSNKPSIPTNTSDLTNDSNFVDTSNPAVSSGITSAKVTDYDTHIADTDIHVTTADKNKWNNQTYVFRYSSTALTPSSTNSNALLDNTDNLKVGDKVIDSRGVLFSVTAIDTQNSTFTIGTALIDLAQDSDVVHKSGNETVGGEKTFNDLQIISYGTQYKGARNAYILPEFAAGYSGLSITTLGFSQNLKIGNFVLDANNKPSLDTSKSYIQIATGENNGVNACILEPRNSTSSSLGTSANKWSKIYGTEYYYGSNNVEFSTKFVTTDTAQDVTANKNFKGLITTAPDSTFWPETTLTTDDITFLHASAVHVEQKSSGKLTDLSGGAWNIANLGIGCFFFRYNNGTDIRYKNFAQNTVYRIYIVSNANRQLNNVTPETDNTYNLGDSTRRWSTINGLEPSSLSLPDLSNGIDISSYITIGSTDNNYTPPANGWIWIRLIGNGAGITQGDFGINANYVSDNITQEKWVEGCLLVTKDVQAIIRCRGITGIVGAKFYPCLGNV